MTKFVLFLRFIYLFIYDRHRERERAETQEEGEAGKQAPCREPDVGLDPGLQDCALGQR